MSQALINAVLVTHLGLIFSICNWWANSQTTMRSIRWISLGGVCGGFFVACYGLGLALVEVSP